MARPRIEFIQNQLLPWDDQFLFSIRPGTKTRILSQDRETGACSLLVQYPENWQGPAGQCLNADEEFLVLDGQFQIGSQGYDYLGYGHLPAGYERAALAAPGGAVILTFFASKPGLAAPGLAAEDTARLVEGLDGMTLPYTGNFHPEFPPGAGRRMLFDDPKTGDQTWLLGTLGLRWAERAEVHPVVEEMFLISGEVHGNLGLMRPGAYFWRPPEIPHGPYGSLTGNIYFFRTKGGPLSTSYQDAQTPFRWWPDYQPVLPASLAGQTELDQPITRPW